MKIHGKEVRGECANCGEVLTCELLRQGQAIGQERSNVVQMLECQIKHREKRERAND